VLLSSVLVVLAPQISSQVQTWCAFLFNQRASRTIAIKPEVRE
jgi:hypothetical protein